jgi:quinol monooxygenase YgiN
MIVVIGSALARDDVLGQALALSLEHVQRSRLEPGCLEHGVSQDAENPCRLVFVEKWESMQALQRHLAVSASRTFVKALAGLLKERPSMDLYEATTVPTGSTSAA